MPKTLKLSPTAVKLYLDCPRKFWFERIMGLRTPETAAMRLGTAVHWEAETYLGTGEFGPEPTPADDRWTAYRIALTGLEALKPLRAEVVRNNARIETAIKTSIGGVTFNGRLDFAVLRPQRIVDHKTTSDLKAYWHLDAEGMKRDLQLLLYAGLGLPKSSDSVRIGHIYYATKAPLGCRELHVDVDQTDIRDALDRTRGYVERIKALSKISDVTAVPFRRETCKKFGGCPHRERCPDSPANQQQQQQALAVKLTDLKLPPSKRTTPLGLFSKKTESKPATQVAPGQVSPTDAPPEAPPGANAARAAVVAAFGAGGNVMTAVVAAIIAGVTSGPAEPVLAWGTANGWWTLPTPDALVLASGPDATKTATAEKTEKPTTPPADKTEDKAERVSLIATIEKAYNDLGADPCDTIMRKLGIKQFRKAGTDNLREFANQVEALRAAKPKSLVDENSDVDAKTFLALVRKYNAELSEDEQIDFVEEADVISGMEECGIPAERIEAAAMRGQALGYWKVEETGIRPNWSVIYKLHGTGRPVDKTETPDDSSEKPDTVTRIRIIEKADPQLGGSGTRVEVTHKWTQKTDLPPTLFVGCLPVGVATVGIEDVLEVIVGQVEAEAGCDIRLIEFAMGPKMLASKTKVALRTGDLVLPGLIFIPPYHPWESELVPVLAGAGALVIRAVK